jgi:hypothetical protein
MQSKIATKLYLSKKQISNIIHVIRPPIEDVYMYNLIKFRLCVYAYRK